MPRATAFTFWEGTKRQAKPAEGGCLCPLAPFRDGGFKWAQSTAIRGFKAPSAEAAREPDQCLSDLCDSAGSYIRAGSAKPRLREFWPWLYALLLLLVMIKGKNKGHTPSDPAEARRRPTSLAEGGFKSTQKVNAFALRKCRSKVILKLMPPYTRAGLSYKGFLQGQPNWRTRNERDITGPRVYPARPRVLRYYFCLRMFSLKAYFFFP